MKKRKAEELNFRKFDLEILQTINEREELKKEKLFDLIVNIVVKVTLDEFYAMITHQFDL